MKIAIYARVSRKEGQDTENQLMELRRYASISGSSFVEFVDLESGKTSANRTEFQRLMLSASRREFHTVLVWALDRFTREGVPETFAHIARLRSYGVEFESFTEPHFRTTGPAGELMIAIAAWIAKQERLRISERTKAGLAMARVRGKTLGRPVRIFDRARAAALRSDGFSWRRISKELGISLSTLHAGVQEWSMRKESRKD